MTWDSRKIVMPAMAVWGDGSHKPGAIDDLAIPNGRPAAANTKVQWHAV